MTRTSLKRTMRRTTLLLVLVLAVSLAAKLADHVPGIVGGPIEKLAKDLYEYLKDMALVFVTVVAAYLAGVFQKRQNFLAALKEEWREIIRAKSALFSFTQLDRPSQEDYLKAFCAISETIDNMRTVYRNVGETGELIGLYPYAPLHDMRRALQSLEPRKSGETTPEQRKLARDAILQSFYALRESFLEELDLEAPDQPLLIFGSRRLKKPGSPEAVRAQQDAQRRQTDAVAPADPTIDALLTELYAREHQTAKPWRAASNGELRPSSAPPPLPAGQDGRPLT